MHTRPDHNHTRHGHPLVPLWQAAAARDRFDIGARLREIESDILSEALDQPIRALSAYDLWLDRRLEDGTNDTWLKERPVFVVTTLCRLLGHALLREDSPGDEYASGRIHAAGFGVVVEGEAVFRQSLDQIATDATGALDEPGFDPFRNILRECILDNWPIGAGEVVLGELVPQRRLHSLRTASLETLIGVRVLEHFLIEAGALWEHDPRPDSRRLFDAQAQAGLLAKIPTLVGPIAMRNAMGATRMELEALTEAGVLKPRTRVKKVKNPWRMSDGVTFVTELSDGVIAVGDEDKDWETLLFAYRCSGVALDDMIRSIRNKRLTVGKRAGVPGFHGIVVPKSEVDVLAAPLQVTRDEALEEVPGSMAAAEFGRSVGLRDGGVFQAMIEAGHVSVYQIITPRTGRPQYRMTPEHMAAFHRRFVTLTTLSTETEQHRNTLRGLLKARRITPFSPDGQDFGAVYLRGK